MRFGFAVPIFANPGVPDFRTPSLEQLDWPAALAAVLEAERLGYDSVWVADHLFLGRDGAILEGWTTLSALAGATSRIRLGTIHLGNEFRPPALTAKMAATLDVISGGRLDFFVDPGWREREHTAYGYDWRPDRSDRVGRTAEALDLTRRLWREQRVDFAGQHYRLDGAICAPKPVQPGGPPVWIGEAFDSETLELIVRHADVWNSMPAGPEVLADKIDRVRAACRAGGRDPSTLRITLETQVLIYDDRTAADRLFERFADLRRRYPSDEAMRDVTEFVTSTNPQLGDDSGVEDMLEEFLVGTPEEVIGKLRHYRDLGVDEVICWFMDFPEPDSLRRFVTDVVPQLGGGS